MTERKNAHNLNSPRLESKVQNGAFQVQINMNSIPRVTDAKCTCRKSGAWCSHIVATLAFIRTKVKFYHSLLLTFF